MAGLQLRVLGARLAVAVLLLLTLAEASQAGTYYEYREDRAYWWYAQEDPSFWLLVPSDAVSYRDVELFGTKGVDLVLREGGPYLSIRRVRTTNVDRIWDSVRNAWSFVLENARVTTNQQITTSNNVRAHFRVLEATAGGTNVMIRFVAFTRGDYSVYLAYYGTRNAYSGRVRDVWLRAVNSFEWR